MAQTLPDALRSAYRGAITQDELAVRLGVRQATISSWVTGASTPSLDDIARFEELCGRPRGWVLIQAGYVEPGEGVEAALERDPHLTPEGRAAVLGAYRGAVAARRR